MRVDHVSVARLFRITFECLCADPYILLENYLFFSFLDGLLSVPC